MSSQERVVELLCELIRRSSVNPEHHMDLVDAPYGEGRMAPFVRAYFEDLGVHTEVQEVLPGRANVLAHIPGRETSAQPWLLEAHMDTVDVQGMEAPFVPRIADGRVYGRGACDTKGTLAAMMLALRELLEEGTLPARPVVLAGAADEEFGMTGALRIASGPQQFAGAIVGEPTGLRVVPSGNGQMYVRIRARGKAAHTSTPFHGINAIYLMNDVIAALRRRVETTFPSRVHPRCGAAQLTVSIIQGGSSEHVVPDHCVIALDRRVLPGETCAQAVQEIREWLAADLAEDVLHAIEVEEPYKAVPPMETREDHPLVQGMLDAVQAVGRVTELVGVPYNTDASHYSAAGIPCVIFGPGNIAQAHGPVEWIDIAELVDAVAILKRFLLQGDL